MKNKLNQVRWCIIVSLCGLCFFFSCSDNLWENQNSFQEKDRKSKHKNKELTTDVAQQWYQSNYEPVVTTRSNLSDPTNRLLMMPYWERAKESNRSRYEVVEIPIKTKRGHIILDYETSKKWKPNKSAKFIRNTAKIVIERDKKTGKTRSFMMVFIGSYNYLKMTRTMEKNTYLYRQPDFDGMVLFYELNGTLINGWKYTKGKISGSIVPKLEMDEMNESSYSTQTRGWVEDCYTDYIYESDEVCEEDVSIEYDDEYGESWVITSDCWDNGQWVPVTVCDGYWEDDDDDNWEDDNPSGGSETSDDGNGGSSNDEADRKREEQFQKSMAEIKEILAKMGIDISKYIIKI